MNFSQLSGERLARDPGTVVIDGVAAGHLSITQRRRLEAAFVPEERLGHGTAPRMKLSENAPLTGHAASGMVQREFTSIPPRPWRRSIAPPKPSTCAGLAAAIPKPHSLSGGNLQKFIVGREILPQPPPYS